MMSILKKASTYVELQQYIVPYKRKLLDGLKSTAHKKKAPKENITNLVDSFQLKFQEISSILILISDLPSSTISVNSEGNHSQWLQLSEHLLIRASELRMKGSSDISETMVLPPSVVLQISNWIVDFLPNKSIDVTSLIEAFMLYIKSCPQQTIHISDVSKLFFVFFSHFLFLILVNKGMKPLTVYFVSLPATSLMCPNYKSVQCGG